MDDSLRREFEGDFLHFCRFVFFELTGGQKFDEESHHKVTADALMDCWNNKNPRVIISMPPGFGKTTLAVFYIAWSFLKNPSANYIYISYSEIRGTTSSTKIRNILSLPSVVNIWGNRIKKGEGSKSWYVYDLVRGVPTQLGRFLIASCDGQITGFDAGTIGGDARHGGVIIDDLLKASDAYSDIKRKRVWTTFTETILTRLRSPSAVVIIIMQRLHPLDLVGCILAQQKNLSRHDPEKYRLIKVQAWDPKTKKASWEKILPRNKIESLQKRSPDLFEAQYQQTPENITNGVFAVKKIKQENVFDKMKYKELENSFEYIVRGWDFNYISSAKSDFTAGIKLGYKAGKFYILDVVRVRAQGGDPEYDLKAVVNRVARNDLLSSGKVQIIQSFPEDPGYNIGLVLSQELSPLGITVKRSREFVPKLTRWYPLSVSMRAGDFIFVQKSSSSEDEFVRQEFEHELKCGSGGEYDDQIDALSRAFDEIQAGVKSSNVIQSDFVVPIICNLYDMRRG